MISEYSCVVFTSYNSFTVSTNILHNRIFIIDKKIYNMNIKQVIKECVQEEIERQTVKEIIREELNRMYNEGVFDGVDEGLFEGLYDGVYDDDVELFEGRKKKNSKKDKKEKDDRGKKSHARLLNKIKSIIKDQKINMAGVGYEYFDKIGKGPKTDGGKRKVFMDMINGDDPSSNTDLNVVMSVLHNRSKI